MGCIYIYIYIYIYTCIVGVLGTRHVAHGTIPAKMPLADQRHTCTHARNPAERHNAEHLCKVTADVDRGLRIVKAGVSPQTDLMQASASLVHAGSGLRASGVLDVRRSLQVRGHERSVVRVRVRHVAVTKVVSVLKWLGVAAHGFAHAHKVCWPACACTACAVCVVSSTCVCQ
jgi:hypothetical protein